MVGLIFKIAIVCVFLFIILERLYSKEILDGTRFVALLTLGSILIAATGIVLQSEKSKPEIETSLGLKEDEIKIPPTYADNICSIEIPIVFENPSSGKEIKIVDAFLQLPSNSWKPPTENNERGMEENEGEEKKVKIVVPKVEEPRNVIKPGETKKIVITFQVRVPNFIERGDKFYFRIKLESISKEIYYTDRFPAIVK